HKTEKFLTNLFANYHLGQTCFVTRLRLSIQVGEWKKTWITFESKVDKELRCTRRKNL
ncbi:hypothetical protein KSS87_007658, partial [Heliosperma pusillum]